MTFPLSSPDPGFAQQYGNCAACGDDSMICEHGHCANCGRDCYECAQPNDDPPRPTITTPPNAPHLITLSLNQAGTLYRCLSCLEPVTDPDAPCRRCGNTVPIIEDM